MQTSCCVLWSNGVNYVMLRRVVWDKLADVSEALTTAVIVLMTEAVSVSETSVCTRLYGETFQKTVIIMCIFPIKFSVVTTYVDGLL